MLAITITSLHSRCQRVCPHSSKVLSQTEYLSTKTDARSSQQASTPVSRTTSGTCQYVESMDRILGTAYQVCAPRRMLFEHFVHLK